MKLTKDSPSAIFCGLCRVRIDYARIQQTKAWSKVDWMPHEECKKHANFWVRSMEYWERKLKSALTQRSMDKFMKICKADADQISKHYEDMGADGVIAGIQ